MKLISAKAGLVIFNAITIVHPTAAAQRFRFSTTAIVVVARVLGEVYEFYSFEFIVEDYTNIELVNKMYAY
ncbi:unnamed protein product [Pieris brassicae]|uniref:Secreted protein n=1 Tax=Pieris brassicae TaxID=7116 RepID=A0A9P0TQJ5_PIEBR|nr:unnamed protein product [Pieris brassicae]